MPLTQFLRHSYLLHCHLSCFSFAPTQSPLLNHHVFQLHVPTETVHSIPPIPCPLASCPFRHITSTFFSNQSGWSTTHDIPNTLHWSCPKFPFIFRFNSLLLSISLGCYQSTVCLFVCLSHETHRHNKSLRNISSLSVCVCCCFLFLSEILLSFLILCMSFNGFSSICFLGQFGEKSRQVTQFVL